ncbi:MAG: proton-conducting transporter membrane subunit, partial [Cyanobacteria bacterium J06576_12]
MVQYTLAQSPEVLIDVAGRDSNKAREKAMDQLMSLMDDGKLPTELDDGFNPKEFIEVKEPKNEPSAEENAVVGAVQTLSNLAKLKIKVQGSREEALKVRELVDLLFTDDFIEEEQIEELNSGFKTLKTFAQTNLKRRLAYSSIAHMGMVLIGIGSYTEN